MKVGDLVMFFDDWTTEAVLIVAVTDDGYGFNKYLVINDKGEHWVDEDELVTIEEWKRITGEAA